jgi:hypothetical protein
VTPSLVGPILKTATVNPSATPILDLPTSTLVVSPTSTTTQQILAVIKGDMSNQIERLESSAPRPGSQDFVRPDDEALADFKRLVENILAGRVDLAAETARKYEYELVRYTDRGDQNAESYILREQKPFQRGWGLYVFRTEACTPDTRTLLVEAPHTLADEGTPLIALKIFRALHSCALLVAGAHRDANPDGSADVAHNPQTVFQAVHEALAKAGNSTLVLQVHGFNENKHPGYPPLILGMKTDSQSQILVDEFTTSFAEQGVTSGICDGTSWRDLCGDTNVQSTTEDLAVFIHLELSESLRKDIAPVLAVLVEVFS